MTFDEVMRFAAASVHALARSGTDNRVRPLIELAYDDWIAFTVEVEHHMAMTGVRVGDPVVLAKLAEVELHGCIVRPKADTVPASVAFGAALSALPALSKAAGCYTGIHVTALTGIDPRMKP